MLEELRNKVWKANLDLVRYGLVKLTWGNVSGLDRESGLVVIKPSGVDYSQLKAEDLVILDLDGKVVEGSLRPSSDTPTHLELYRAFPEIGGVVHTHSCQATAWAQACRPIPLLGTTHADCFSSDIPCTPDMSESEIMGEYELNTGKIIVRTFRESSLSPCSFFQILKVFVLGPVSFHRSIVVVVIFINSLNATVDINLLYLRLTCM